MSARVTETIESAKDILVGTDQQTSITAEARRSFDRFAVQDGSTRYMTSEGFINALTASSPDEDFRKLPREQYAALFLAAGNVSSVTRSKPS